MRMVPDGCCVGLVLLLAAASATGQTHPTSVSVRLDQALSTGSSQSGDSFTATLDSPLVVNDRILAEPGERVTGQTRQVVSSGRLSRPAVMTLVLRTIQTPSGRYPIQTGDLTIKAASHVKPNLLIIGGLMGAGAAIGGATGGGKGALIGTAAGAGTGTGIAYLTGKREILLPPETLLTFHVNSVTISPKELSRLQRSQLPPEKQVIPDYRETHSVVVVQRDDDDNEYDGENNQHGDDGECCYREYPRNVDVIFLSNHRADVTVYWQGRTERMLLDGDNLDEIMNPLCERTHIAVKVLRPRIRIHHDGDEHEWHHGHGHDNHDHNDN